MCTISNPLVASWKRLASISFLFALCFSLAAQNGCEDEAGNIYGPYEELVVSDDPCENFTCIPSAFSFVWVSNSEFLDDCGGDEDDEEEDGFDDEELDELIEWLEEICASGDTLEVDFDVEEACALLEMIQACLDGDEAVCEEVFVLIEELGDSWGDEEDDEEEEDEDDEEEDDEEEDDDEEDGDDEDGDLDELEELIELLTELCGSNQPNDLGIDPEMACGILELIEACNDGSEEACVELESLLEDLFGDDDDEEDGEDGDEDDDEGDDEGDDEEEDGEDDEDEFDEEELEALMEWLEEICGSNVPNELGFDPDMACGILELIEACANGSEEACMELEMLLEDLEDLWDEEDEEDEEDDGEDDEEEEEAENECEVEFEFEQAMDEDGVPLPYNIIAYVDEPEAGTYYFWSFGDGNESDEPNPTHIYEEVGNYEVCLTVSQMVGNLLECTSTHCDTLMIDMDGLVRQQLVLNVLFPGQSINSVSEQTLNLDVFPNPASEVLSVRVAAGIELVEVRTTDGRLVGQWAGQNLKTIEVPCAAWPSGAYVMHVRTSEGEVRSRVLIQH